MLCGCYALQSVLIITVLAANAPSIAKSTEADLIQQTLKAVKESMTHSPDPWSDEWKKEYIQTIEREIQLHANVSHFAERLNILRKGFGPYWESFNKTAERLLFDVRRAQIRWYIEHLMETEFPTEQQKQAVRERYITVWNEAAESLLTQFPFLDPNAVQAAKTDSLRECYRRIDAPLLPIYSKPFEEKDTARIEQRWHALRYARVDLWRQLGGETVITIDSQQVKAGPEHPHYLLTQRSLTQLTASIRPIFAPAPEYYIEALNQRNEEQRRLQQANVSALNNEKHLQKSHSRQTLQAEQISFLLKALLESPSCFDGFVSVNMQERQNSNHQKTTEKGGDAYDLKNDSPETYRNVNYLKD